MTNTKLSHINALDIKSAAQIYEKEYGFGLVAILPKSKKAFNPNWQNVAEPATFWENNPNYNVGALLNKSKICTLDIDELDSFKKVIEILNGKLGVNVEKPFWLSNTAGIKSGRRNSAKLVFKIPDNIDIPYRKLTWEMLNPDKSSGYESKCVFEIRVGAKQDILPPSIHPDTKQPYQWVGSEDILDIPDDLVSLALNWDLYEEKMKEANPNYQWVKPKLETKNKKYQTYAESKTNNNGKFKFLKDWIEQQDISSNLEKYGYVKKQNNGRFLSPDSQSGSAGIQIYNNKFYSFGESDYFADGHLHDAFDLMCHFEFNDDKKQAINYIKRALGTDEKFDRNEVSIHIDKPYYDGSKFLCEDLARDMLKKYENALVTINGVLYIKTDEHIYVNDRNLLRQKVSEFQTNLTEKQKDEALKAFFTTHDIHVKEAKLTEPEYIPFKTAVYNIRNGKIEDYTDNMIFTYKIPYDFKPTAKPTKMVDDLLNSLSKYNDKRRLVLEEILGYPLYRSNSLMRGKMVFLDGESQGGKSTFQKLCSIVLTGNYDYQNDKAISKVISTLKIHQIGGKFETERLENKWLNLGDDLKTGMYIRNTDIIKSVISGDSISAQRKFGDVFDMTPFCKLIFSTNKMPKFDNAGGAMTNRIHVVKFENMYLEKNSPLRNEYPDAEILDDSLIPNLVKDEDSIYYLIRLAVEGVTRLYSNKKFTVCDADVENMKEYTSGLNLIENWMNEEITCEVEAAVEYLTNSNLKISEIKEQFRNWAYLNDYVEEYNDIKEQFTQMINKKYHLKSDSRKIGGKSIRVFLKA